MTKGSSTDFTTVYTVLKHAQKISAAMGQRDTVITFDLAIYIQAKQIQMSLPGKKFCSSGLEDLLIEFGVYAAGTTSAVMKGESYNRGVRAHKLVMEGLFRLMWSAFIAWYKNRSGGEYCVVNRDEESQVTEEDSGDCSVDECAGWCVNEESVVHQAEQCRLVIANKTEFQEAVEALHKETTQLC